MLVAVVALRPMHARPMIVKQHSVSRVRTIKQIDVHAVRSQIAQAALQQLSGRNVLHKRPSSCWRRAKVVAGTALLL